MSYRFEPGRRLDDEVRRVGDELLGHATARLERPGGPGPDDVHDIRKDFKKLRSLLRLVREPLGVAHWRGADRHLRDTARQLSALRDADVLAGVVAGVADRAGAKVDRAVVARVQQGLAAEAAARRADASARPDFTLLADGLGAPGLVTAAWPLDDEGFGLIEAGLRRQYRQGRDAFRGLGGDPSGVELHELRKRVKDHWYHLRLLRKAWTGPMRAFEAEAGVLAEHLGDDHDLWVLRDALTGERATLLAQSEGGLLDAIDAERSTHLAEIRAGAARLYAERPRALSRRLSTWWHVT